MKLRNPFSQKTRNLYLYRHDCDICGMNGQDDGGLELNHITGRYSSSPTNASVLCSNCHRQIGHTQIEERYLFQKNLKFLLREGYKLTEEDLEFMKKRPHLIKGIEL